ncbi:hypothetical protein BDN72DRAFT_839417 [Pluteus cervinus]|uniref:Uncharacterized protein n=1 Tax=Pluteus cervinus TaxID=181527 RepID=A0ACD3AWL9_9AGAR|nr:hypothetical protein BDN72DRAFT_839417 [Pluteus cervinus]
MNTTVSTFFSRDTFLKRQARTQRARSPTPKPPPMFNSMNSKPLHIILEEDEARVSARSPSPSKSQTLPLKLKRKQNLNVSDIRIAKGVEVHSGNDLPGRSENLLSAPRPAPRPPTTPSPSGSPDVDSFNLTFIDTAFNFPIPPIPTPSSLSSPQGFRSEIMSPTPSMSSPGSSPCSNAEVLPKTPATSDDDELPLPSPRPFNPRRASIKPLMIARHKHFLSIYSPPEGDETENCGSLLSAPSPECDRAALLSPLTSPGSSSDEEGSHYESDPESDSEWYSREFSKILSLSSHVPANFPRRQSRARSESDVIPTSTPSAPVVAPTPSSQPSSPSASTVSSDSKKLNGGVPSAQLDPAFPKKRRSIIIPTRPPPPPPVVAQPKVIVSPCSPIVIAPPRLTIRPPPRSSVPEDFIFDDDACSTFSVSFYANDLDTASRSPLSVYSQASFARDQQQRDDVPQSPEAHSDDDHNAVDTRYHDFVTMFDAGLTVPCASDDASTIGEVQYGYAYGGESEGCLTAHEAIEEDSEEIQFPVDFDLDIELPMMLPLSLPGTPIDLEADIAMGLEELRMKEEQEHSQVPSQPLLQVPVPSHVRLPSTSPRVRPTSLVRPQQVVEQVVQVQKEVEEQGVEVAMAVPAPSSTASCSTYVDAPLASDDQVVLPQTQETSSPDYPVLRSKWSSSTLSSVREEKRSRRGKGASAKLRLYFGGSSSTGAGPATPSSPSAKFHAKKGSLSGKAFGAFILPQSPSPKTSPALKSPGMYSTMASPSPSPSKRYGRYGHGRNESDTTMRGHGVRRSPSLSVSDAGSEESTSSSGSSGLRRKPIPVEMFLRS